MTDTNEVLVMRNLQTVQPILLDQIVEKLPELSWNQIFQTVDALCRRGVISLRRRGFDYELSLIPQDAIMR